MSFIVDNRTYASVVFNNDRDFQLVSTNVANFISTPVNFLAFYLILAKSRKEMKVFKYALFISHFCFYLANIHYGTISNVTVLFPFPGVSSIGIISDYCNTFYSTIIWLLLFGTYVSATYIVLLIRLRIVARTGRLFDLTNRTYFICGFLIVCYVNMPVSFLWLNSFSEKRQQVEFVASYFPRNLKIFQNPSVYINISRDNQVSMIFLLIFLLISGLFLYVSLYAAVIYEISMQAKNKSVRMNKNQKKVVNNLIIQSSICANIVGISFMILIRNAFIDPSVDNRISIAVANTALVSGSIPTLIMMIYRNSSYRNHVTAMFGGSSFYVSDNQVSVLAARRSTF